MPYAPPAKATPVIVASPAASSSATSPAAIAGMRSPNSSVPTARTRQRPRVALGEQRAADVRAARAGRRRRPSEEVVERGTARGELARRQPAGRCAEPRPEDVVPAEMRARRGERLGKRRRRRDQAAVEDGHDERCKDGRATAARSCLPNCRDVRLGYPNTWRGEAEFSECLSALLALCGAASARGHRGPASAVVLNSCQYNYDDYYRDTDIDVTGTRDDRRRRRHAIRRRPDAGRPRPDDPPHRRADPGHAARQPAAVRLRLRAARARAELITARRSGSRSRRRTPLERVQVQGPFTVTADDDDRRPTRRPMPTSATPASTTTTPRSRPRRGRPSAATSSSARPAPARCRRCRSARAAASTDARRERRHPRNAARQRELLHGLPARGDAGRQPDRRPPARPSARHEPLPFDTTITGPRNVTCISAQGRLVRAGRVPARQPAPPR